MPPDPLPRQPVGADGEPVFAEPWQARAFALAVELHERGLFTWPEWSATLAATIERARAAPGDPETSPETSSETSDTYYLHWLAALERLVAAKGVSSSEELAARKEAWDRAAHATPHGKAIVPGTEKAPG